MRYLTLDECRAWATRSQVALSEAGLPERYPQRRSVLRFELPSLPHQLKWLCGFLSQSFEPREEALLWIKEFGTFPACENLHLYYRVRQSYGDFRLLNEAAGHLFLNYERSDLESFLLIRILNGWEMHLFPRLGYGDADIARAVIAHDNEWIAMYHEHTNTIAEWRLDLERSGYTVSLDSGPRTDNREPRTDH